MFCSCFGLEIIPYSQSSSQAGSTSTNLSSSFGSLSGDNRTLHSEENAMWQCLTCTLLNRPLAPICELCGTQQPRGVTTYVPSTTADLVDFVCWRTVRSWRDAQPVTNGYILMAPIWALDRTILAGPNYIQKLCRNYVHSMSLWIQACKAAS